MTKIMKPAIALGLLACMSLGASAQNVWVSNPHYRTNATDMGKHSGMQQGYIYNGPYNSGYYNNGYNNYQAPYNNQYYYQTNPYNNGYYSNRNGRYYNRRYYNNNGNVLNNILNRIVR